MKRNINYWLLVLTVIGFFNFLNSQNLAENISRANKELLKKFEKQEQERTNRINVFVKNNPSFNKSISNENSQIIYVYDIIDGKPIYKATDNQDAGRATKTSHLHTGGSLGLNLDGTGMTIGVWDGGPAEATHPEFSNTTNSNSRVTVIDLANVDGSTGTSNNHGTHVTGTISSKGVNIQALGMAPNVNVKSYNWTNDEAEMVTAANDAGNPIVISNHSYGIPIDQGGGNQLDASFMGSYSQDARDIDNIAKNNPQYLIVTSAGNSGNVTYTGGLYAGYDKLTTDKNAKNNLVVANASPSLVPFSYELASLFINSGSSQGPTDDLRIKPDIAADGTNLFSTVSGGGYASFTGTSMSAPNTAGTLILLQQYYNQLNGVYMNSSTLKALVCHTSVDDGVVTGPDPEFGWGFLDAKVSAEAIASASNNESVLDELTLDDGQTYTLTFSAQAGENLKATICWTDMPGDIAAGVLNDPTPRLVNDLDLRLSKDGTTFLPWKLDYSPVSGFSNSKGDNIVDNIEVIDIDVPETGSYTLTVTHKGSLDGNVGGPFDPQSQDFSLLVTGSNLTLGVKENALAENLLVYPNPNRGEFVISFDSTNSVNNDNDVKIDIYDIRGRLVYESAFNNVSSRFKETIYLNNVKSGMYIANISQGNNSTSQKIIIK